MENDGSIFTSTTDTEVIMHLIARSKRETCRGHDPRRAFACQGIVFDPVPHQGRALRRARSARLQAAHPRRTGDATFLSSETCAFDLVGAKMVREVEARRNGENRQKRNNQLSPSRCSSTSSDTSYCIFEYIYFSRPDSFVFGDNVDKIRRKLGRQLAKEHPAPGADLVMGVPDSATTAALGFSEESDIRFDIGLIRNHYVGRTFIQPGAVGQGPRRAHQIQSCQGRAQRAKRSWSWTIPSCAARP